MNNIINTPQNNPKNLLNQNFQSQQKKAKENHIYNNLVAQCSSKTIDNPKGVLLKNNGPVAGLAIGTADAGKDVVNLTRALKDGKTNDHSLGRMNDLGLKIGGLGIAAYLMTTKGPKTARMMEFVGLGTFLATMTLWPRVFIDLPLKLRYGFNIRQKYKDSQGRKKEFFQDNQYLPWDLWSQKKITKVGDRMGIPRNIKDRDEFTKRNMQKVALQGNTLWMLSAGFATPLLTSMACRQTEKILERRNIEHQYQKTLKTIASTEAIKKGASAKAKSMNPFARIFPNLTAQGQDGDTWLCRLLSVFRPTKGEGEFLDPDSAKLITGSPSSVIQGDLLNIWEANTKKILDTDKLVRNLTATFKDGIPVITEEGSNVQQISEEGIRAIIKEAKLEDSTIPFSDALKKAFINFVKKQSDELALDDKVFEQAVHGLESPIAVDEKAAVEALSGVYDDVVRRVKAEVDLVQEAINAAMGNRAESITTQAYKQAMQDVLEFVNPDMKQLDAARGSTEKAYKLLVTSLQKIGQNEAEYGAFARRLTGIQDSDNLLKRVGKKIRGVLGRPKADIIPSEKIEETIKRVQEYGYKVFEESAAELNAHGFTEYAQLFDKRNPDGLVRALDNTMDLARVNLNATRSRYIMGIDFENRLKNPDFMARLTEIAKRINIKPEVCVEGCRKIIYCHNINDFMVKNSIYDVQTYYDIMKVLFQDSLDSNTVKILQNAGCESLLQSVNYTRTSMVTTGIGANYHPIPAMSRREDILAVVEGQSKRYVAMGETIPDFFSKAANELYKDKKWMRIFGTATLVLIGTTLLTQLFFGRRNDKHLYEKKEKEVKNVGKK